MEAPAMGKGKSQVDNDVWSCTKIELMVAKQVAFTTDQFVAKEIPKLVANSLDDILQ